MEGEEGVGLEALPRELVWHIMAFLPVHDVLLGAALTSRSLRGLLLARGDRGEGGEAPEEFWRQYALRWRLVFDESSSLSAVIVPDMRWQQWCRDRMRTPDPVLLAEDADEVRNNTGLEGWRFTTRADFVAGDTSRVRAFLSILMVVVSFFSITSFCRVGSSSRAHSIKLA